MKIYQKLAKNAFQWLCTRILWRLNFMSHNLSLCKEAYSVITLMDQVFQAIKANVYTKWPLLVRITNFEQIQRQFVFFVVLTKHAGICLIHLFWDTRHKIHTMNWKTMVKAYGLEPKSKLLLKTAIYKNGSISLRLAFCIYLFIVANIWLFC